MRAAASSGTSRSSAAVSGLTAWYAVTTSTSGSSGSALPNAW